MQQGRKRARGISQTAIFVLFTIRATVKARHRKTIICKLGNQGVFFSTCWSCFHDNKFKPVHVTSETTTDHHLSFLVSPCALFALLHLVVIYLSGLWLSSFFDEVKLFQVHVIRLLDYPLFDKCDLLDLTRRSRPNGFHAGSGSKEFNCFRSIETQWGTDNFVISQTQQLVGISEVGEVGFYSEKYIKAKSKKNWIRSKSTRINK